MAYLCVKQGDGTTRSFSGITESSLSSAPYVAVKSYGSIPLTTEASTNNDIYVKISNSNYRMVEATPLIVSNTVTNNQTSDTISMTGFSYSFTRRTSSSSKTLSVSFTMSMSASIAGIKDYWTIYSSSLGVNLTNTVSQHSKSSSLQLISVSVNDNNEIFYKLNNNTSLVTWTVSTSASSKGYSHVISFTHKSVTAKNFCTIPISGKFSMNYAFSYYKFTSSRTSAGTRLTFNSSDYTATVYIRSKTSQTTGYSTQ